MHLAVSNQGRVTSIGINPTTRARQLGGAALLIVALLAGCSTQRAPENGAEAGAAATSPPKTANSAASTDGSSNTKVVYKQIGEASWYGPGFQGQRTASGERFNQNQLTAAHPTLPLGTRAEITNLENGKKVVVKINDRGPYVGHRAIDLSRAAARQLDMQDDGKTTVKIAVTPEHNKAAVVDKIAENQAAMALLKSTSTEPTESLSTARVKTIQRALHQAGYKVHIDGQLGAGTRAALKKYQRARDLTPTGQPDVATLARLNIRADATD